MQPNLLRNRCFLPTKNKKYQTFYRTHFLLISLTCLSRYISLSFYRPALGYTHLLKYLLCSAEERNSYRFGITWGWVNDCIFIFGWTMPLNWLRLKYFDTKYDAIFINPMKYKLQCFIFKIRIWNRCKINTAHPWPLLQSQCHMIHQKSFSIILFCWKRNIS